MARKIESPQHYIRSLLEESRPGRAHQKAAAVESASIDLSSALGLRSMSQRHRVSLTLFSCILLLNGLPQEIKPSVCASKGRLCFSFSFPPQRLFWRLLLNLWLKDNGRRYHLRRPQPNIPTTPTQIHVCSLAVSICRTARERAGQWVWKHLKISHWKNQK